MGSVQYIPNSEIRVTIDILEYVHEFNNLLDQDPMLCVDYLFDLYKTNEKYCRSVRALQFLIETVNDFGVQTYEIIFNRFNEEHSITFGFELDKFEKYETTSEYMRLKIKALFDARIFTQNIELESRKSIDKLKIIYWKVIFKS